MSTELKIGNYATAIIYGYLLVFASLISVLAVLSESMDFKTGVAIGLFSLIYGGPVMIVSIILGYSLFKLAFSKLNFSYFGNVMVSCVAVAFFMAGISAIGLNIIFGDSFRELSPAATVLGLSILMVAPISGVIFWYRTK